MKKFFAAAAIATLITGGSSVAYAGSCPKDMKAIDSALSNQPKLSSMQLAKVSELRAEGEALHKAGKHKDSVKALHEAMRILGVK